MNFCIGEYHCCQGTVSNPSGRGDRGYVGLDEAVIKLDEEREETRSEKKSVFATFLDSVKKKFYAENPFKRFLPSFVTLMETRWQVRL